MKPVVLRHNGTEAVVMDADTGKKIVVSIEKLKDMIKKGAEIINSGILPVYDEEDTDDRLIFVGVDGYDCVICNSLGELFTIDILTAIHIAAATSSEEFSNLCGSYKYSSPNVILSEEKVIEYVPRLTANKGAILGIETDEFGETSLKVSATSTGTIITPDNIDRLSNIKLSDGGKVERLIIGANTNCLNLYGVEDCEILEAVEEVTIKEGCKVIAANCFKEAENLKAITLPNGLQAIGADAFNKCSLREVIIPETVRIISQRAFGWCSKVERVVITDGVKYIGEEAFIGCKKLKSIDIPTSLTVINTRTFAECQSLESISIPSEVKVVSVGAFYGCDSLVTVKLHEGLEIIDEQAFCNCESLQEIDIPSTVESIEANAFEECRRLKSVKLHNGIAWIGEYAFYQCTSLKEIDIPDSVKTICSNSFTNCKSLKKVTVSNSTEIEDDAFPEWTEVVIR